MQLEKVFLEVHNSIFDLILFLSLKWTLSSNFEFFSWDAFEVKGVMQLISLVLYSATFVCFCAQFNLINNLSFLGLYITTV